MLESENKYDNRIYPDFSDVARNIRTIIDSSEYDKENKGAYKGSLLTRLQSLTTGINGLIFSSDELNGEDLFNENVIIDLRRLKKFPQDKYINEVEQRFESITRLKHIKIIARGRKMIEKEK